MALLPRARVTEAMPWGMGTHLLQGQDSGMWGGDTPAAPPDPPAMVKMGTSTGPLDNKSVKGYLDICSSDRISWD